MIEHELRKLIFKIAKLEQSKELSGLPIKVNKSLYLANQELRRAFKVILEAKFLKEEENEAN